MLRDLASLETNLELKNYEHYLKIVKKLIREKSERHDEDSKERLKEFRTFSIGKLMQITPITFEDHQSKASVTEFFS